MTNVIAEPIDSFTKEGFKKAMGNANAANNAQFKRNPKPIKELP